MYVASKMFLTRGVGRHKEKLVSFEMALREAGIAAFNIVTVSSIFPPNCEIIPVSEGLKELSEGQIVHAVVAKEATNEHSRLAAASIGVAIPRDRNKFGFLSEHHSFGEEELDAGNYAEDLAAQMLATILGLEFDATTNYDERREVYQLSEQIVESMQITQTAEGIGGQWTTVLAAAILLP
ncbi:MAG: pyruvoyl-dependent arginine decarboxylase [Candidatus Latescibacterota bacterium]|jgi:arginine decarboxylase